MSGGEHLTYLSVSDPICSAGILKINASRPQMQLQPVRQRRPSSASIHGKGNCKNIKGTEPYHLKKLM